MAFSLDVDSAAAPQLAPRIRVLQHGLLWLVGFGCAIVSVEPSPYEVATLLAIIVFFATGLRMPPLLASLLVLQMLINIGYTTSAANLLDQSKIISWISTSWYMAITALFFGMVLSDHTEARLDRLARGCLAGAVVTSLAGIAGYFHAIPGGYELLTEYGRARGFFKDPNVFGAFLILPALLALQCILLERFGKAARHAVVFGIIAIAVLLSFSRAAWGQLLFTSAFVVALTFATSRSSTERTKIVVIAIAAAAVALVLLVAILSVDTVGDLFKQRASLEQSYDSGRFGRFGRHVLGFEMALDLPLGIGPLQFSKYFPEDTHNSFLNAFMSGGWLAGVCYPVLWFMTAILGFRYLLVRTPWQRLYIAFFAAFLGTFVESFIIDTDHWRQYFMMLGAMWGMFAATQAFLGKDGERAEARNLSRDLIAAPG